MNELEKEIHLKLSNIKIDNDNLDYIKATGELCGKLRWELVDMIVKIISEREKNE